MKVLVTGANGFVGNALVRFLHQADCDVNAVIRQGNLIGKANAVFTKDIRKDTEWSDALNGVSIVVHTAARAHVIDDNVRESLQAFREVNTLGTLNLAEQAAKKGVKRFIFISTIGVNGAVTYGQSFSEEDVPQPHNDYAVSKWEAEQGLMRIAAETGMAVTIIRPPLIYGPGAPGNFRTLAKWVRKGVPLPFARINNSRSFLALDNLIDFIVLSMTHPKAINETFLLADSRDVSTSELITSIADAYHATYRLFYFPRKAVYYLAKLARREQMYKQLWGSLEIDLTKARTLLGWQPLVTMDEQLNKMVK
ncbi:NAD-dependent epimerase/dehydratase family protein [Methylophaga thiooxydans]|uniref:NAD dependent epimerase/dehydratase family n=1 Tax=Methylophaga thiooxydans DMS010 TaxID=637616 RepID=C0N9X0_9GAMM|nr:NAD-dependent epimerase/dehydratase family protein [Methylophaga thiooxydans]EEF78408.1 NAD dependent epimerase/dehydratase family [Methylophaga thiooxydans DMS010]